MPERPSDYAPESPEQAPFSLEPSVDALRNLYGSRREMPESLTQEQINEEMAKMRNDAAFEDVSEFIAMNKLLFRKNALQRQAEFEDPAKRGSVDVPEFVVVNEAQTYFEYLDRILGRTLDTMDQCVALRRVMPNVSPESAQLEREAQVFADELKTALDKRLTYSNAALVSNMLAVQRNRTGEVMMDQSVLVGQLEGLKAKLQATNAQGLAALTVGDAKAMRIHSNSLDQRIVDLIAQKGDVPGKLLLQLQTERYQQTLSEQIAAVKEGKDYKGLESERRALSGAIIQTAEDFSEFHEDALALTQIKNQFKSGDVTLDATMSNPDETPESVRKAMTETMEVRSDFHRERLAAFVNKFDEEVLTIGVPERIEEFSNVQGREFVRVMTNKLSAVFTLPVPETAGARDFVRERLSGRINEAMGWPAEKMDMTFEELSPEEQQEVMKRAQSVAQAVREFDRQKLDDVRDTLDVFASLSPASEAVGQPQPDPENLPDERVTAANMQSLIDAHGLPTVYLMAVRQLNADMGSPGEGGFLGEVQIFTGKLEDNIGVHLDVADALNRSGDEWMNLALMLLAAAGISAAAGYVGPKILKRVVKKGIQRLRRQRTAPAAAETQAPRLTPRQRAAKIAGKAGFLLAEFTAVAEIAESLHQTYKAGQLDDVDTADAALELWQAADIAINGGNGAYSEETRNAQMIAEATGKPEWVRDERLVLEQQRQLLVMKHILESRQVSQATGSLGERGSALEQRRLALLKAVNDLAGKRAKQLPFYRQGKPLVEQPFTRDGRTGGINVNESGSFGLVPVKFRNGPIEEARTAGAEQRAKDKFDREKAKAEFEAVQSEMWEFQGTLEGYLGDLVDVEEGIEK